MVGHWENSDSVVLSTVCKNNANPEEIQKKIEQLEKEIMRLNSSISEKDGTSGDLLEQYNFLLKNLHEERDRGIKVQTRFTQLNNMDSSTSFFFALDRKVRERKLITHLKLSDGRETTEKKEIVSQVLSFHEELYSAQPCDSEAMDFFLSGIPKLSGDEKIQLEKAISFEELSAAAKQQSSGRSPGLDGLTSEFYKTIWSLIGPDLHAVFLECEKSKILPLSCRRAVITLLPKKGDLGLLKNWRPISLLGIDYKILSKTLTNHLKEVMASIIDEDQSYCIPRRSIFDNLFLVRDLLHLTEIYGLDVGLLSLDQEKAFDRVDYKYLFNTLSAFGFGEQFISWIQILYTDVCSMLKINGTLTRTFPVRRGVRQGCSLSGLLYAISIEPLLRVLGEKTTRCFSSQSQYIRSYYS